MKRYFNKLASNIRSFMQSLPRRKQYIEFFTAMLSLPIMITAIILNVNALRPKTAQNTTIPSTTEKVIIISPAASNQTNTNASQSISPTQGICREELPSVSISSPQEGETVSKDAVCIAPDIAKGNYCAIVWRYSVNNSSWSDYDDKAFCLYNLASGNVTVRLQVKSTVTGATQEVDRHFTYSSNSTPTPTTTASSSAH